MPPYVQDFFNNILESLQDFGPKILSGVLILVVGWILAAWAVRGAGRLFDRSEALDQTLKKYISKLIRFGVLALTVVAALSNFGVQTASIIALLGAMGLAVGLALQGTLANVASGLVLLFLRPFRADDLVEVNGKLGVVQEIGVFATELKTLDGLYVMIPNARVWGDTVINLTRNPIRRVEIVMSISYSDDMDRALEIINEVVAADERVLEEPEPFIKVADLGASSVDIWVRPWTNTADFFATKLDMTKKIKERFDEEGITIPFPQRDIHVIKGEAA